MRLLAVATIVLGLAAGSAAQTPAPAPAQPAPAAPRPRPAAPSTATAVLTVSVTDAAGAPIADVKVTAKGPLDREGTTTAAGQVRLLGLRAGTYRLHFEKVGYIPFEKEVTWRTGTPAPVDATLSAAPAPPPPPPAPEPAKPAAPEFVPDLPAGKPSTISLLDYIERNFISSKEPRKESLVGCSAGAQSWLWQVRDPWQGRKHDNAELMLYVVGGDGLLTLDGREVPVAAGSFAVVPRGTEYGFTRRGRNPLILLATMSGPACAK